MAYRRTALVEARRAGIRERIVSSAVTLIAHEGFRGAQVARIAERARIASGTVYCHFPSKAELCAEVFRSVCEGELEAVAAAARVGSTPADRIASALETFGRRALQARVLAYALLVEPVDPAVDVERLEFRRAYVELFAGVVADGVDAGSLPPQDPAVSAASLVGAMGEALVGPLSSPVDRADAGALVDHVVQFCMRAITAKESWHVRSSGGAVARHARSAQSSASARGLQRVRAGSRPRRRPRA